MPEKYYTVAETAKRLNVSTRTIHRYIKAGLFENLFIIEHPMRNHYFFTDQVIRSFQIKYNRLPEEKPKRAYNKRKVKGKHRRK